MKRTLICILMAVLSFAWAQSLDSFFFMHGGDWYLRGGEKIGHDDKCNADVYAVYDADGGYKIQTMSLLVDEFGYLSILYDGQVSKIIGRNVEYVPDIESAGKVSSDYVLPSLVNKISSSDYLVEKIGNKTVEYKAENLLNCMIWGSKENPFVYNWLNTPFVPKDNGNCGIGTKLTVNLKKAKSKIMILGGYADPARHPDYYYKNCRPKTVKINDLDSDYSVSFDLIDYAFFQQFDLGKSLTNIEIEVVDVYKGTKYTDLCISGIAFK